MRTLKRYVWYIVGVGAVVLLVGFVLVRPDKLFVDDAVDESLEEAFTVTTTSEPAATTTTAAATETATDPQAATTPITDAAPPSGPVAVGSGDFYGIDHAAEGTATVYVQDGVHVLRFEDDTDIQNGPDLYVWVLPTEDYPDGGPTEYLDLGKIKGNVGGQNYELPAEYDPTVHRTVLIWCLRFGVPFAAAPLVT